MNCEERKKENESQPQDCACSLEMTTNDVTLRIKRGLSRDKERDYKHTEPVVQLSSPTKHIVN